VSEQSLEGVHNYWILVELSFGILAAFASTAILLWLMLLVISFP
jgi:hypothetical protein